MLVIFFIHLRGKNNTDLRNPQIANVLLLVLYTLVAHSDTWMVSYGRIFLSCLPFILTAPEVNICVSIIDHNKDRLCSQSIGSLSQVP